MMNLSGRSTLKPKPKPKPKHEHQHQHQHEHKHAHAHAHAHHHHWIMSGPYVFVLFALTQVSFLLFIYSNRQILSLDQMVERVYEGFGPPENPFQGTQSHSLSLSHSRSQPLSDADADADVEAKALLLPAPKLRRAKKEIGNVLPLQGNRAITTGYVADFSHARLNPQHRREDVTDWADSELKIAAMMNLGHDLKSCHYLSNDKQFRTNSTCLQPAFVNTNNNNKLLVYNSALFPRTWCGTTFTPMSAKYVNNICPDAVKLLPYDHAPINGNAMPPIVVKGSMYSAGALTDVQCEIPCKHDQHVLDAPQLFIEDTDWTILQTRLDQSDREGNVQRYAFLKDIYYSSPSLKSSIPLSRFSFDNINIFSPSLDYDQLYHSGSYLIDDFCDTQPTKRHLLTKAISTYNQIASYGQCDHTTDLPAGKSLESKEDRLELLRQHRFNMAFDIDTATDHVTGIVYDAFEAGTLPVVAGAANMKEHFPPNSFIFVNDFSTHDALASFINSVISDKSRWESYHSWRYDPAAKEAFEKKFNFTRTSPMCRTCRWAYAKKYALHWNHEQQQIEENTIPRRMCIDETKRLVTRPFLESWHTASDEGDYEDVTIAEDGGTALCYEEDIPTKIINEKGVFLNRQLQQHDGVIDMIVTSARTKPYADIVLRLTLPVKNRGSSSFQDVHDLVPTVRGAVVNSVVIQDTASKVTVLTSWSTKITCPSEGVIEITVQRSEDTQQHPDETKRVRVFVEDLDPLHDKVTEFFPSSFGKMMIQDFVDPMEIFYSNSPLTAKAS